MFRKLISIWALLIIVPLILVVFFLVTSSSPTTSIPGHAFRLKIPDINVDAHLESVGLSSENEMDVPKNIMNAAWFNLGPQPGEKGSAVIDGHFGWKNGIPAVFDNLSKLKKGDRIYVEDANGISLAFIVRETRIFGENEDASIVFSSNDGGSHLNLITCGGSWNKVGKSYVDRVVVFADKENDKI